MSLKGLIASLLFLLPSLSLASPIHGAEPWMSLVPRATSQQIHLKANPTLCLSVIGEPTNGATVFYTDCNIGQKTYTQWDISFGNNAAGIKLSGTNYCLDATTGSQNNTPLKVWQCYPGLFQQTWYYTDDLHIAITGGTGGGQCMDLGPNGMPQTYNCFAGNTNQIWTIGDTPSSTTVATSATKAVSTTGMTTTKTTSTSTPPPATTSIQAQLHFSGSSTGCLGVNGLNSQHPPGVNIVACAASGTAAYKNQTFSLVRNAPTTVTLPNYPGLCLAVVSNPDQSGSPLTFAACKKNSDGSIVQEQNWYYTTDNHLAVTGLSTCLDVAKESSSPYGHPEIIQGCQIWQCGNDPQQVFTV